jgi:hypothetical protein
MVVHNQLLKPEYIEIMDKAYDLDKVSKMYSQSLHALSGFEIPVVMNNIRKPDPLVRIPEYDDFVPEMTPNGSGTAFIALTEVDPSDEKTLFNFNELGDYIIDVNIPILIDG